MKFRSVLISCFVVFFINLFVVKFVHAENLSPTSFSTFINAMYHDQSYSMIGPSSGTSASSVDLSISRGLVKSLPSNAALFSFELGKQDHFNITWNDGTQNQIAAKKTSEILDYIQNVDLGTPIVISISDKKTSANFGGYFRHNKMYYVLAYNLKEPTTLQPDVTLELKFADIK